MFSAGAVSTTPSGAMYFNTTNVFEIIGGGGAQYQLVTTQLFRDPSAWYHIVVAFDTTQATSSNRIKLYVNGSQVTAFSTATYPSLNFDTDYGNSVLTAIGSRTDDGTPPVSTLDGYLAEFNYIDGAAKTPSDFGAYDTNGIWQPAAYTGSYGTNGAYLKFTDVGTTSGSNTGYGKDFAGTNYWTTNNFGTTSTLTTYDSMLDSPTNAAGDIGNYPVLNPLATNSTYTLSNANLSWSFSSSTASNYWSRATFAVNSGKWYWEINVANEGAGQNLQLGIQSASTSAVISGSAQDVGSGYAYIADGTKVTGSTVTSYGTSYTANDVVCVALDLDNGAIYFGKQTGGTGSIVWQNSGDPTSGASKTGAAFTSISGTYAPLLSTAIGGGTVRSTSGAFNFGQRPFSATAPSGYSALNTQNLSTPTITNGAQYMAATTYTGNGSSGRNITNGGNNNAGTTFAPDLVWVKIRSSADNHRLADTVRGANKSLSSNLTDAESSLTTVITGFNADGFTIGTDGSVNTNTSTYVGWQWKGGGTGVTNTSGSITSTVSANTSAGFSVVTWTGNGSTSSTVTIGHGLGVAPAMIIIKKRSSGTTDYGWSVWHTSLGGNYGIFLNTTGARNPGMWAGYTNINSTVFSPADLLYANESGQTYVTYCFAPVAGYSAFGSYTGNGSTDGPFVYTGFRPRWIMGKCSSAATSDWFIYDTSRATYNASTARLYADTSGAETTGLDIDILSNGFKFRALGGQGNDSGSTYIFAAFAENPFKISRAR